MESAYKKARANAIKSFEREWVASVLKKHNFNVSAVSRAEGIDRVYMHRLMRRHGFRLCNLNPRPLGGAKRADTDAVDGEP